MKIIKPSFKEMYDDNPQKHIEKIARICYKSEDLITDESHKKMIKNLYDKKHWAMLEHFIFVYQCNTPNNLFFKILSNEKYITSSTTEIISCNDEGNFETKLRYILSFSARSLLDLLEAYKTNSYMKEHLIELCEQIVLDYDCDELFGNKFKKVHRNNWTKIDDINTLIPEEQWMHGWKSIKFICDRGVSHEIVRHRDSSYAQESTRYCNYSKDKFDNNITVIDPLMFDGEAELQSVERNKYHVWRDAIKASEKAYFELLELGATPQEARSVLGNSLKTEIIMTAHNYEWGHFFELRCDKAAHPQMRELALPLFDYFVECDNTLFNENAIKFNK